MSWTWGLGCVVFVDDKVESRCPCIAVDTGLNFQKHSGDAVFVQWSGGGTAAEGACNLIFHQELGTNNASQQQHVQCRLIFCRAHCPHTILSALTSSFCTGKSNFGQLLSVRNGYICNQGAFVVFVGSMYCRCLTVLSSVVVTTCRP